MATATITIASPLCQPINVSRVSFLSNLAFKTLNHSSLRSSLSLSWGLTMRDRSKNRKPLQRGRLSSEVIQTAQALKRAAAKDNSSQEQVIEFKVRRLLKLDMVDLLRELIRQNQPLLAHKVFEEVRKEYWYKPQLLIFADMIKMFASNSLLEKVELLLFYLKMDRYQLNADAEGFNALFGVLMDYGFTSHAMECFQMMKEVECEPNESTFGILVNGLESAGETDLSSMLKQEAEKYFGWRIEFAVVEERNLISS